MNYPNNISYKNRGMSLEEDINITNEYYLMNDIAVVYKKPTPIVVTKIGYKNKSKIIQEGYFKTPSTTDYNGLYKGNYIDFEAKETNNKTSFPLSNIHAHQINHIKNIINHKGIAFIIIRFSLLNENYILKGNDLLKIIEQNKKSIPYLYFKEKGFLLKENYQPRLDYIKIVDLIIKE
jgi:recombination protein U